MNFKSKFYYLALGASFVMIVSRKKIKVDYSVIPYLILCVIMGLYNIDNGILAVVRVFSYAALYLVGYNISQEVFDIKTREISTLNLVNKGDNLLKVVACGSFAHYILNFFVNVGTDIGRNTNDVWTGTIVSATAQVASCCLILGISAAIIICPKRNRSRIWGILVLIGILSYNLILAGRTIIIMILIVYFAGLLFYHKHVERSSQTVKIILYLLGFILLIACLFYGNIFGIKDLIFDSNLYDRFIGFNNFESIFYSSRIERKIYYLKNMLKYPFGGLYMRRQFGYAHDLFLDAYDEYGILSLFILIIILITGMRSLIKFCSNKDVQLYYRLSFLSTYIAIIIEFCAEPIFAGIPWLFVCYCLINGALSGMNRLLNHKYQSEF